MTTLRDNLFANLKEQMKELYYSLGCGCCGDHKQQEKALKEIATLLNIDFTVDEDGCVKLKF
jgi:hypothetical protein